MDIAVLSDIHGNYIALEKSVQFALDYDVEQVINDLHKSGLYDKAPSWCRVRNCS